MQEGQEFYRSLPKVTGSSKMSLDKWRNWGESKDYKSRTKRRCKRFTGRME